MIVYQAPKAQFLIDAANGIEDIIQWQVKHKLRRETGVSEYNSWKNSLGNAMFHVMNTDRFADELTVAIEYSIPRTNNRIDFIVLGENERGQTHMAIIELKQWTKVLTTLKDAIVQTRLRGHLVETNHPSYQAWSYAALLLDFNQTIRDETIALHPCAYVHNMVNNELIASDFYGEHINKAPVFCKGDKENLQNFLSAHIKRPDSGNTLLRVDRSHVRPSKELADMLDTMLKGHPEFVLIDNQKLVYENALSLIGKMDDSSKHVMIIKGGPGTGKSVVAIHLLSTILRSGYNTRYVTKNRAPRTVFEVKLTGTMSRTRITNLFQGSGGFVEAQRNQYDALIIDEAHRLNEKSGIMQNRGQNQIMELIYSAQVSVFFVDEDQRVTWQDIGEVAEIEKWAKKAGATVHYAELETQFRCNGSNGYLAWLDNTLQIRPTANPTLEGIDYDFQVLDSPRQLRDLILEKNRKANKARLLAGYCWKWVSKKDKTMDDIIFPKHNFSMQWNLAEDGGAYAIAPNSVEQVGCIHTIQGLDLHYAGVIIGPDFVVRDGKVVTRPEERARTDKALHGFKKALKENETKARAKADAIIKNTYKTLLSRAMQGCYIYCTDQETAEHFKNSVAVKYSYDRK